MRRKILILGGARFHGLLLAEHFHNAGEDVYVLNRGKYKSDYSLGIKHLIADRNNTDQLKAVLSGIRFDVVIDNNAYNPSHISSILELVHSRCSHYVFTSSAAVYLALSSNRKLCEKDASGIQAGPYCPKFKQYALGKLAAENYLKKNAHGLAYTVIRLPNVFGEGDFLGKLVYFYDRLRDGGRILLEEEIRGFNVIYVRDVVKIFQAVAENKCCFGRTINAADTNIYNYNDFFRAVYEDIYSRDKLVFMPAQKMWETGYFPQFAWGPMMDTSLCADLIGKSTYTPIIRWGKSALDWEIGHFKNKPRNPESVNSRALELKIIEGLGR